MLSHPKYGKLYLINGYLCVEITAWRSGCFFYGKTVVFPLHRLISEETYGRDITLDEIIHHIDGDPLNNDPGNLAIMTRKEHSRLHNAVREGLCLECKSPITPHDGGSRGLCVRCYHKIYSEQHREEIATYRKARYMQDREGSLARQKEYWEHHKEEKRTYNKMYYKQHKAEIMAHNRAYYEQHKEELRARMKEDYKRRKEAL